ncbi:MAG: hypothetical protein NTX37_05195 [Burkholderiales bacterium]|nr:hypothetical protein [Burkholderiales bacterium]
MKLPLSGQRWRDMLTVACLMAVAATAQAQSYVNVTVGGAFAPGAYGEIAIGNNPPPPVINPTPVAVAQPAYGAPVLYLYVPEIEYREWHRYCHRYNACGRPVYFIRVDERDHWWERHNRHLRGEDYYRRPPGHFRDEEDRGEWRRHERRGDHDGGPHGHRD